MEMPIMFKDDLFLITGATGNTGAPTVEILRAAGRRVRAFVHTRDARSRYLEDLGAEVVDGDLQDFDAVSSAMVGVTAAYFCYPISPAVSCRRQRCSRRPRAKPGFTRWSICLRFQHAAKRPVTPPANIGSPNDYSTARH
jgi:hypothetical protein